VAAVPRDRAQVIQFEASEDPESERGAVAADVDAG
jgi:hypothetical protein